MNSRLRHKLVVVLGLLLTGVGASGVATTTTASAATGISCNANREARRPVVLVHGFNSSPQTWRTESRKTLAGATNSTCVDVFDYASHSDEWVTDEAIGPALAQRIQVLSRAFSAGGGDGKVIVVGHSMGGLATRCAVSSSCNGGEPGVADQIAEVITFGTPNLGAFVLDGTSGVQRSAGWILSSTCNVSLNHGNPICKQIRAFGTSDASRAFKPGSNQLHSLPAFPSSLPVYALAARVDLHSSFFGLNDANLGSVGDGVVDERSALATGRKIGKIGGRQVIHCGKIDATNLFGSRWSCLHSTETNDTRFLEAAAHQIKLVGGGAPRGGDADGRVPPELIGTWCTRDGSECLNLADLFDDNPTGFFQDPYTNTDGTTHYTFCGGNDLGFGADGKPTCSVAYSMYFSYFPAGVTWNCAEFAGTAYNGCVPDYTSDHDSSQPRLVHPLNHQQDTVYVDSPPMYRR